MARFRTVSRPVFDADGNENGYEQVDIPFTPEEEAQADAELAAYEAELPRKSILKQIADLEAQITPRRLREAVRGSGKAWLENIDDQIAALRVQLK